MYTIEEAAQRTGVSTHTLRYYERIGLLAPVGRASSGHRRYSDDDLGAVGFLTLLRQTGMPIRDMQRFVELTRAGDDTIPDGSRCSRRTATRWPSNWRCSTGTSRRSRPRSASTGPSSSIDQRVHTQEIKEYA